MVTRDELRETLRQELTRYPTRDELRQELARYPTRDELRQELARYPTRDELRQEFARHATREELYEALAREREQTTQGFADMRRYMDVLYENLQGTIQTVLETLVSRMDRLETRLGTRADDHERRLTNAENRLTRLEHERQH
jgi:DNA-directed RNA polymerase specialized sigma subunit